MAGAFHISKHNLLMNMPREFCKYLHRIFKLLAKFMPIQRPIVVVTLRSHIVTLSNLFDIACNTDFLLEHIELAATQSCSENYNMYQDFFTICLKNTVIAAAKADTDIRTYFRSVMPPNHGRT